MQDIQNQSLSLPRLSSHMTTPYWPIAANASMALFSLSTMATSALSTGEATLSEDRESPVSLTILPSPSSRRPVREESGYDVVADLLQRYYSLFLLLFGTVGNVLCFGVLSRKTFRKSTIGIFLRFLTLADLSALWTGVFYFVAKGTFHTNIRKTNELSCKIHFWLSYACCDLGSWALVLVSSARLASILRPMSHFITNRRAYVAILFVITLALSVNLPIFFMYGDVYIPSRDITKHCVIAHTSYRYFIIHVWTWIVLFKFAVIPGVILLGLNIVLIVHVYRSKRIIEDMQRGSFNKYENRRDKARSQVKDCSEGQNNWGYSSFCCGCSRKQVPPLGHGIHQLSRGLANKISFSRWRRKAVVNKDVNLDSNNLRDTRRDNQKTSLEFCEAERDATDNRADLKPSEEPCNGKVHGSCSKLSKTPFQSSNACPKITFQDQEATRFISSQRSFQDRLSDSETQPIHKCSLHESYADVKQLRDAFVWDDSNPTASAHESILFLNHNVSSMYDRNKVKSCSHIPTSGFMDAHSHKSSHPRPCSLSLLKKRNGNGVASEELKHSIESSCDQFFTGGELELSPDKLTSQFASRATIQDQMLYDDLIPQVQLLEEVEDGEGIESFVNYKGGRPETSVMNDSEDESESSSGDEFFSCADDTKFSPCLRHKHEDYRIVTKTGQSHPNVICEFENPKSDQSIIITGDNKISSLQCNKDLLLNKTCKVSNDSQTTNVIVNDLALLCENSLDPTSDFEKPIQNAGKEPKSGDYLTSDSVHQSKSCDTSPIKHNTLQLAPYDMTAETGSSDCLRVVTSNNICDINVTRCSSTNDVISLDDHTPGKSHEAISSVPHNGKSGADKTGTSHNTDKTSASKSTNLNVERRWSGHKRDKQVSLADLNLSLSSLGKTSLNSGNTDISSFTIAPPSAFTSAENLTTTTNAEKLKCRPELGKTSVDQHAVRGERSLTASKHKRSQQRNKGQKSVTSMFPRSSARPKNLTRTLLVINSVFLLCNIPIVIYMTGKTYFFPGGYNDRQNLLNKCANFIMYTNNALNFLLYCLTGTRFRHQLRAMFVDAGLAIRGSIRKPPRRAHL